MRYRLMLSILLIALLALHVSASFGQEATAVPTEESVATEEAVATEETADTAGEAAVEGDSAAEAEAQSAAENDSPAEEEPAEEGADLRTLMLMVGIAAVAGTGWYLINRDQNENAA
jgi:hypothetical protein